MDINTMVCKMMTIGLLFMSGCAPSHILNYQEDVSRDHTYIAFSRNCAPYVHRAQVGGEHMSYIHVLGFRGDAFFVQLTSTVGEVQWGISGDNIDIGEDEADLAGQSGVTIVGRKAMFTIDVSAHPYGEYILRISKQGIPAYGEDNARPCR